MNDWRPELAGIQSSYRFRHGVDKVEDAFRDEVQHARISLPHNMILCCAKEDDPVNTRHPRGRIILVGDIVRAENPSYFRYAYDFDQARSRGVVVLNGNQAAGGAAERLWGTLRLKLRCPSFPYCSYAPDVYSLELDKLAMVYAMLGRHDAPLTS